MSAAAAAGNRPPLNPTRLMPAPNLKRSRLERLFAILDVLREVVTHDYSALHDEFDALHLCNVVERIARYRNDVGESALLNGADLILPVVIQHVGRRQISGLQCLDRSHTPFCVIAELIGLFSVRDSGRCRSTSEHD